jgi:hypothetical protein
VVRSVTHVEAEWDEKERAWALALLDVEADVCPGCGHPLSETTDPDAEGGYEVEEPTRCHACTPLGKAHEVYKDHPPGLHFVVKRR